MDGVERIRGGIGVKKDKEWLIKEIKQLKKTYGDGYDEYTKKGGSYDHAFHMALKLIEEMDKPEKLYEVKLPTENAMGNTMNLVQGGSKNRVWFDSLDDRIVKFKFTEKEIKSIDERYWAFAVEVTDNV